MDLSHGYPPIEDGEVADFIFTIDVEPAGAQERSVDYRSKLLASMH